MNKITVIVNCIDKLGGVNVAIQNLCNELCKNNEVEIISIFRGTNEAKFQINLNKNIKIKYAVFYKYNPFYSYKNLVAKFMDRILMLIGKAIFKLGFQVYTKINKKDIVIFTLASVVPNKKTYYKKIINIHIDMEKIVENKYSKKILNNLNFMDAVVVLSNEMKNKYNKCDKVKFIPNVLDLGEQEVATLNNNNIAYAGRLNENEKQITHLLKAFSLLDNKTNIKLNIFGDGEDINRYINMCKNLDIEKNVIFRGVSSNLLVDLAKMDLIVMTSKSEGLPNILVEAASIGIPLLSYESSSGIKEIIKNGVNGYIVEQGCIEIFSEKINEIMNNPNLRNSMGKESFKIFESKFSKSIVIKKWDSLIGELNESNK